MRAASRSILTVLLLAVSVTVGASAAHAGTPSPGSFKIKTKTVNLDVDVVGYVVTDRLHDTKSDCFPGQRWIQTNAFRFEAGKPVRVKLTNVSAPGLDPVTTSSLSRSSGSAVSKGTVSDYSETNHCPPTAPEKLGQQPACVRNAGKLRVSLTPGELPPEKQELAPLQGRPLYVGVFRAGGGANGTTCIGTPAGDFIGVRKDSATALTPSSAPGFAAVLPAKLDAIKVFNLKRGKTIRRAITAFGPCSRVRYTVSTTRGATPPGPTLNADGDCFMRAKILVTIRRAK
jgi:hypothetical protein